MFSTSGINKYTGNANFCAALLCCLLTSFANSLVPEMFDSEQFLQFIILTLLGKLTFFWCLLKFFKRNFFRISFRNSITVSKSLDP